MVQMKASKSSKLLSAKTIGSIVIFFTIGMMALSLLPVFFNKNIHRASSHQPPSLLHIMGIDRSGRGIFSQLVSSSKAYFLPGLLSISISLLGGTLLGATSGYYTIAGQPEGLREKMRVFSPSGIVVILDGFIRYVFELINSLPRLALIFLVSATVSTDFLWIAGTLGIMGAMKLGSQLRSEVILLRQEAYIEAAVELGLPDLIILGRHLLWTRLLPLLVSQACYLFAEVILIETTLRFFFQIIPDGTSSWGKILVDNKNYIFTRQGISESIKQKSHSMFETRTLKTTSSKNHLWWLDSKRHLWWLWFFPALFIVFNIISLYLLADAFGRQND